MCETINTYGKKQKEWVLFCWTCIQHSFWTSLKIHSTSTATQCALWALPEPGTTRLYSQKLIYKECFSTNSIKGSLNNNSEMSASHLGGSSKIHIPGMWKTSPLVLHSWGCLCTQPKGDRSQLWKAESCTPKWETWPLVGEDYSLNKDLAKPSLPCCYSATLCEGMAEQGLMVQKKTFSTLPSFWSRLKHS